MTVDEGAGTATIIVSISSATTSSVSVLVFTSDETATAPEDYGATSTTATMLANQTSNVVQITIVDDAADEPDETFTVVLSDPSAGVQIGKSTSTVTILTNGTAYTFTVTALNALGAGPPSTSSPSVIPRTVPGAPTNVLAVAGDETATVTWDAPASDGGSPILQYDVLSSPGGLLVSVASTTLAATVTGLTNFVAYAFTVTAVNSVGPGPASDPSNSVTPPQRPAGVFIHQQRVWRRGHPLDAAASVVHR